ncbi:hypothetical protein PF003_g30515 [Phytophthora fragariae]|nr:hypothetical protein PF003_g30518 [Phytophthora fragariae]KAE8885247.1 hypothetical protein PF003_g30515 [Phytophthora fragariae]
MDLACREYSTTLGAEMPDLGRGTDSRRACMNARVIQHGVKPDSLADGPPPMGQDCCPLHTGSTANSNPTNG